MGFILDSSDAPGHLKDYGGSLMANHLLCNGAVVSQATYPNLFARIGTNFNTGGEGAGNFRLPDSRRRVHAGSGGTGTGTLGNAVGNSGGEETHQLDVNEMPSHSHNSVPTYRSIASSWTSNSYPLGGDNGQIPTQFPVTSTGGSAAHNNIQPTLIVTKQIRY